MAWSSVEAERCGCTSGGRADPYVRALDGKVATIERLYYDYEDNPYLVVTMDDDPAQQLMRDTGRFHYFSPREAEVIQS